MEPASVRTMQEGEREAVLDLLERCFGVRELFGRYLDFDPALGERDTWLAVRGGLPVACVQVFSKTLRVHGEAVAMGGIGSVATDPSERKRGLASLLVESALADMRCRGMAIALLFTGRHSFYQRHGFVALPRPSWQLGRPRKTPRLPAGTWMRDASEGDWTSIASLYESYCGGWDATTLRDEAYWLGQREYAGNPRELVKVLDRGGEPIAYSRSIEMNGYEAVIEFARARDAAAPLAALLASLAPRKTPLLAPRPPDPELREALIELGAEVVAWDDPSPMWRVLDRPRLETLAAGADLSDAGLLECLVAHDGALYWPSDRF